MNTGHVGPESGGRREVDVGAVAVEVTQLVNNKLPALCAIGGRENLQAF